VWARRKVGAVPMAEARGDATLAEHDLVAAQAAPRELFERGVDEQARVAVSSRAADDGDDMKFAPALSHATLRTVDGRGAGSAARPRSVPGGGGASKASRRGRRVH